MGSVSVLSAGADTTTLYMMVDIVKGDGHVPPTLTRLGGFFHRHRDGMYARKWLLRI
jgi:hypothetical protein